MKKWLFLLAAHVAVVVPVLLVRHGLVANREARDEDGSQATPTAVAHSRTTDDAVDSALDSVRAQRVALHPPTPKNAPPEAPGMRGWAESAEAANAGEKPKLTEEEIVAALTKPRRAEAAEATDGLAAVAETNPKRLSRLDRELRIERRYGDLLKQMGLSEEERERFKKMLLVKPESRGLPGALPAKVAATSGDGDAATETVDPLERTLQNFLGDKRYALYKAYETTLAERSLVSAYESHLAAMGKPLNEDQKQKLLDVVVEERKAVPSLSAVTALSDLATVPEKMAAKIEKKAASDTAILAQAGSFLNPEQVAGVQQLQQRRLETERRSLAAYQQLFRGAGPTTPPSQ